MKKLFFALLIVLLFVTFIAGCSKNPGKNNPPANESEKDATDTETITYDVSFYADGVLITTIPVDKGGNLDSIPEIPQKEGYWGVWDTDSFKNITENITVSAIYKPSVYYVKFDHNHETVQVEYGKTLETLNTLDSVDNKIFSGWFYNNIKIDEQTIWDFDEKDIILQAQWLSTILDYDLNDDGKAVITGASGEIESLIIPSKYNGYTVCGIADYAFQNNSKIGALILSDTVEYIGKGAFQGCSSLSYLKLGKGLKIIEEDAFSGIETLDHIIDTIIMYDNVERIGANAFAVSAAYITKRTFYFYGDINNYVEIQFENEYSTPLTNHDFYLNDVLLTEVNLNTAQYISSHAFQGCYQITKYRIGTSVKSIGRESLENLQGIDIFYDGTVTDWCNINFSPNWVTGVEISYYGETSHGLEGYNLYFSNVLMSKLVTTPSISEIKPYTFYACNSLKEADLSEGVKSIGEHAFGSPFTHGLEKVILPDNIDNLASNAFPPSVKTNLLDGLYYIGSESNPYMVLCGGEENITTVSIKEGTKIIHDLAFKGCENIKNVNLPSTINVIGIAAFAKCTNLETLNFSNDFVAHIGKYAFVDCEGIKTLNIPDSISVLEEYVFAGCDGLESVNIGNGVSVINNHAFYYCDNLETVVFGDNLTNIGEEAFYLCAKLTNLTFSDNVNISNVGNNAFEDCSVRNITMPTTAIPYVLNEIKKESIKTVVITGGTSIGDKAFYDCTGLTNINIPNSVTSIGSYAFYWCDRLTSVTFENTNGWKADGRAISSTDLAYTAKAAEYLKSTYYDRSWTRS